MDKNSLEILPKFWILCLRSVFVNPTFCICFQEVGKLTLSLGPGSSNKAEFNLHLISAAYMLMILEKSLKCQPMSSFFLFFSLPLLPLPLLISVSVPLFLLWLLVFNRIYCLAVWLKQYNTSKGPRLLACCPRALRIVNAVVMWNTMLMVVSQHM